MRQGAIGANDRVRVAVCGIRGQGFAHIQEYSRMPGVEVTAVCDVDENILRERLADMNSMGLKKPAVFHDVRKLLEDKSIDVVSIAAPNHWHALMTIWSCQAGKDVYVEKPCSHLWREGQMMVAAAKKYNRLVQHGTNSRSNPAVREGMQHLRDGLIGDVYLSRGLCYKWRNTIGKAAAEPVPAGVHYDLWLGPAEDRPFTKNRFHYNWHWQWMYGNGDLGNQGIHQLDVARWGLGVKFPNSVSAMGGHFMFDDDQETPNTLSCSFRFDQPAGPPKVLEFEVRHWISNHEALIGTPGFIEPIPGFLGPGEYHHRDDIPGDTIGEMFYGSKGYMAVTDMDEQNNTSYRTWMGREQTPGPSATRYGNNWANFISCVRSRNQADLNSPIEEGYYSTTLLHLANASYRLGRTIRFDPATEKVIGDEEAVAMMNGRYRAPFTLPEKV